MQLTGKKNISWKIRHNKKILSLKTLKKSIKPHQNFTGFLIKKKTQRHRTNSKSVEYQKTSGKNVYKYTVTKLTNMSINTGLNLKTTIVDKIFGTNREI